MALFENSWESLDKARNPELYETHKTEDGKEISFLKTSSNKQSKESKQVFTKEEEENIARAAEKMQDRDD